MALPQNILDKLVSYTYHFELHAHTDWETLKKAGEVDPNEKTSRRESNGTLLINTRRDAHQHIDNVRFRTITPKVAGDASMVPDGDLTMDIIEPGGTFFVEKVIKHKEKLRVKNLGTSMMFGLKIIFVGKRADNTDVIHYCPIIPMMLINFDAKYDYRGGNYSLSFIPAIVAATARTSGAEHPLGRICCYTSRNITIEAKTVQDAITSLEEKLNENYRHDYETSLKNDVGAKEIKYKINLDSFLHGDLNLVNKTDYSPSAGSKLVFSIDESIITMIRKILFASKDVADMVAKSRENINNQYLEGVNVPMIYPRYLLTADGANIVFDVKMYHSGGKEKDQFEFDFYFSGAGKNVDVMGFDIRFPNAFLWIEGATPIGVDANVDLSGHAKKDPEINKYVCANTLIEDKTSTQIQQQPTEQVSIPAEKNDVAVGQQVSSMERRGHPAHDASTVPSVRRAFNTYCEMASATEPQLSFTIRGHFMLLEGCVGHPDGAINPAGVETPVWIKVNIFDEDGQPFYYTGWYDLLTVENHFNGGIFTQILTVIMKPDESQLSK